LCTESKFLIVINTTLQYIRLNFNRSKTNINIYLKNIEKEWDEWGSSNILGSEHLNNLTYHKGKARTEGG